MIGEYVYSYYNYKGLRAAFRELVIALIYLLRDRRPPCEVFIRKTRAEG
jgi:hypothetical protein